jgi:hypothetical protein
VEIMILHLRLNQTRSPVLCNCQKYILKITGHFCIVAILFTDNCYGSPSLKDETTAFGRKGRSPHILFLVARCKQEVSFTSRPFQTLEMSYRNTAVPPIRPGCCGEHSLPLPEIESCLLACSTATVLTEPCSCASSY